MVKWSILSKKDLELLTELGNKLQAGTNWEQNVGEFILMYTKNRIPIPSKDEKDKNSEHRDQKVKKKEMYPDKEAADEALAH